MSVDHNMQIQMENICRTCLSKESEMKSVFDTDSSLGETRQLFEMLMACTAVQLEEDDGLPGQICLSCINLIKRSFSFKKLCEQSDVTLRELLRKSLTIDEKPFTELKSPSDVALRPQETIAHIDCNTLDIKVEFEEGETSIDDPIADTEFIDCESTESALLKNVDDLEPPTIGSTYIEIALKTDDPVQDKIECETKPLNVENGLKIHSGTHRKPTRFPYKCKVCGAEFANSQIYGKHKRVHVGDKPYVCNECGLGYNYPYELRNHFRTHTGEKPFVCQLCDKRFAQGFKLTEHMRAHANERNYVCSVCGMSFVRRNSFSTHMKLHTDCRRHPCGDCGKILSTPKALEKHLKIHTGVRDHVCPYCDKTFSDPGYLRAHKRLHTDEKPFTCDECDKGFSTAPQLKEHQRLHTGEKSHQCHLCPKAFIQGSHLKSHLKRHTGERTHTCVHCKQGFYQASELTAHLRIHTGVKSYTCKVCEKLFSRADTLSRHLKTQCLKVDS